MAGGHGGEISRGCRSRGPPLPTRRCRPAGLRRNAKAISRSSRRAAGDEKGRAASGARTGNSDRPKALPRGGATLIDKILEFAVRQRVLVLMGALALLLLGLWSANSSRCCRGQCLRRLPKTNCCAAEHRETARDRSNG